MITGYTLLTKENDIFHLTKIFGTEIRDINLKLNEEYIVNLNLKVPCMPIYKHYIDIYTDHESAFDDNMYIGKVSLANDTAEWENKVIPIRLGAKITLLEVMSKKEAINKLKYDFDNIINDLSISNRITLIRLGIKIDYFTRSEDANIRMEVAQNGYNLDILAKDSNPQIRSIVAQQGHNIQDFIFDSNKNVRICAMDIAHKIGKINSIIDYLSKEDIIL